MRKNSKRIRVIGGIAVIGLAVGALALAGATTADAGGKHGKMRGNSLALMLTENAERLQLDDATLSRVREIGDAARDERKDLRAATRTERKVLRELLSADSPDEGAVLAQADVIGALETEKRKAGLRTTLAIRSLLTPEQRTELVEIRAERRENRRAHRKGHGRHRDF